MKLKIHYHYPLRDKIVQSTRSYPFVTNEEIKEYLDKVWNDTRHYHDKIGFKFEFSVLESDGTLN